MLDVERLDKVCDEIEELEQAEMSWSNLEKLSILYIIEHHTRKKMEMVGMDEYEGGQIGFSTGGSGKSSRSSVSARELREMANQMNTQQLIDVIVGYGRELNQNGSNGSYNRLYNRMRRYSNNGDNNTER